MESRDRSQASLRVMPESKNLSLAELNQIDFDKEYAGKKNPQRQAFRIVYKKIVTQLTSSPSTPETIKNNEEILNGALVFEFLKITSKYRYSSPKYQPGLFYSSGSRMWTLLAEKLHLREMSQYQQFILLTKFYNFIKDNLSETPSDGLYWQTKKDLLESIKILLQEALQKQNKDIDEILSVAPPLTELIKKSENISLDYATKGSHAYSWFVTTSREQQKLFINYINATCRKIYASDADRSAEQYAIRMGLFYYLAHTSRKGTLYDLCMQALNKTSLDQISIEEAFLWETLLLGHLESIKINYPSMLEQWTKRDKEFNAFLGKVQADLVRFIAEVKIKELDPAGQQNLNKVTRIASNYGVSFVASTATRGAMGMLGGVAIDTTAGTIGFVFGGPPGALIASQVAWLIREKLIPDAAMYLCSDVLKSISNCLGDMTSNVTATFYQLTLKIPVRGTKSLIHNLWDFYAGIERPEVLAKKDDYIKALMSLPDDVFSANRKNIICYTGQFDMSSNQTAQEKKESLHLADKRSAVVRQTP